MYCTADNYVALVVPPVWAHSVTNLSAYINVYKQLFVVHAIKTHTCSL